MVGTLPERPPVAKRKQSSSTAPIPHLPKGYRSVRRQEVHTLGCVHGPSGFDRTIPNYTSRRAHIFNQLYNFDLITKNATAKSGRSRGSPRTRAQAQRQAGKGLVLEQRTDVHRGIRRQFKATADLARPGRKRKGQHVERIGEGLCQRQATHPGRSVARGVRDAKKSGFRRKPVGGGLT